MGHADIPAALAYNAADNQPAANLDQPSYTCPRCFFTAPLADAPRFCPRCGLEDVIEAAQDTAPIEVTAAGKKYRVEDRLAIGSICALYRCRFKDHEREVQGIFKIARDARTNHRVANEAAILRHLRKSDRGEKHAPFLPAIEAAIDLGGTGEAARQANILTMDAAIGSPEELYTLAEVRAQYPAGLDARDMAWIWRRLLSILSFTHSAGIVHTAVLPMHVLIEPREHKLLLIDWCGAVHVEAAQPLEIIAAEYDDWYRRELAINRPPVPALDIALGARCMIELIGGDPVRAQFPAALDAALARYFERCIDAPSRPSAGTLLNDFDHLIDILWGPKKFRRFEMPPKASCTRKGD